MVADIVIRKAIKEDKDNLYPPAKSLATSFEVNNVDFSSVFNALLEDSNTDLLVAEKEQEIIGYILLLHQIAHQIFVELIIDVSNGKSFIEVKEYPDILEGVNLVFKQYKEMERDVLRVLLPDRNGALPTEEICEEHHKIQLDNYDFDSED